MKHFEYLKNLIEEPLCEEDLENVDCYYTKVFALFIPVGGRRGYAKSL